MSEDDLNENFKILCGIATCFEWKRLKCTISKTLVQVPSWQLLQTLLTELLLLKNSQRDVALLVDGDWKKSEVPSIDDIRLIHAQEKKKLEADEMNSVL